MSGKLKRKHGDLRSREKERQASGESRYIAVTLFLAFFIFTFIGAGNFIIVSLVGLFLCAIGLVQSSVRVDLWILVPLILYNGISLLSGYRTYGNTLDGYASTQSVFPVIYLLMSYLGSQERRLLKSLCAVWAGVMATIGIGQFVMAAFSGSATRLSGLMGNPNAMGAMLALGWFALQSCLREENGPALERFLRGLEFITLTALGADAFPWGIWGAGHRRPCDAFLWKRMLFLPAVSIGGNDLRRRLRDPSLHCWKRHELAMALSDPVRLYPDRSMVSGSV